MLLRTVSLNRKVSCVTMPICARSDEIVTSRTSWPSIRIAPVGDVEKARHQVHQRALARAAGADDRDALRRRGTSRLISRSTGARSPSSST